jgi:hypothetical protein
MSVSTTNVFDQYTAGGGPTFAITFYVRSATWLQVKVDGVVTGAYNVVLNANQSIAPGGSVVFLTAPTIGAVIHIQRVTPILQPDVYNPFGPFPPGTVEYDFDRGVCTMQELAYTLSQVALPLPLIPGWFLTNDGTVPLWAPVSGGGGGGISVIGVPTTPTANAAIISGLASNILQLAVADGTHPGITSITPQAFGGPKFFQDGAQTSIFDITDPHYGAIPLIYDGTAAPVAFDSTAAFYAAVAAWQTFNNQQGRGKQGGVYIPSGKGDFWISRPLQFPSGTQMYGDNKFTSSIRCGRGDSATPTLVQGFAGPTIFPAGPALGSQAAINFVSSLLTGAGSALQFINNVTVKGSIINLSDCWTFSSLITQTYAHTNPTKCCFRIGAVQYNGGTGRANFIWGSYGRAVAGVAGVDSAFAFWNTINDSSGGYKFIAYLTTTDQGQQSVLALADAVPGNTYNLEADWDGSNFYFYINGVHQGHVAATGQMVKAAWEDVCLGATGPEYTRAFSVSPTNMIVDSIEFATNNYHTGTGSFTPPTAKYTWGADTAWLWNGDKQSLCPTGQVYFMAQTRNGANPSSGGWILHYGRPELQDIALDSARRSLYRDFGIYPNYNSGGFCGRQIDHTNLYRLYMENLAQYGISVWDADSFYFFSQEHDIQNAVGCGIISTGTISFGKTVGCNVGINALAGVWIRNDDQPGADSLVPHIWGGSNASFQSIFAQGNTIDEEGNFIFQRYAALVDCGGLSSAVFIGNQYQAKNSPAPAAMVVSSVSLAGNIHIGDSFFTDPFNQAVKAIARTTLFNGVVELKGCSFPYSNDPDISTQIIGKGWVSFEGQNAFPQGNHSTGSFKTNVAGISGTDTPSYNLNGITFVLHGFTQGVVLFPIPQVDTKYNITLTPTVSFGSAPATGASRVKNITKTTTGFTFNVETDPGGTAIQYFDWKLEGGYQFPDSYSYIVAIPSSVSNPEVGSKDFAAGVTITPTAGNAMFTFNSGGPQTLLQAGTTPNNDHWWELALNNGAFPVPRIHNVGIAPAFFIAADGGMRSIFNPGPHNVALSGDEQGNNRLWIDGGAFDIGSGFGPTFNAINSGTVFTGERFDSSQALTIATMRNRKIDSRSFQAVTIEPNAGPKAGQTNNVFIGDDFTLGNSALSPSTGSYASQLAGTKYASTFYYYMLCDQGIRGALLTSPDPNHPTSIIPGIFDRGFVPWAANQLFQAVVVQLGFQDILYFNRTAADIWATMQPMLEGAFASGTWDPADRFDNAFGDYYPPSAGTDTVTINGVSFPVVFNTSIHQTNLDFCAYVNAHFSSFLFAEPLQMPPAPFAPNEIWNNRYFSPAGGGTGGLEYSIIVSTSPRGPAANGLYNTLSAGVNGANWGGWNVIQGAAQNSTIIIDNIPLDASFHTDAVTTANDIIARMAANTTINALVVGSVTGANKLKVTARTIGNVGNTIPVSGSNAWTPNEETSWLDLGPPQFFNFLKGGFNGVIQTAASVIVVCTVPPFGDDPGYSSGKEAERNALNALIAAWVTAHAGAGAVLADFDLTLRDPSNHNKILPAYLASTQYINDAGHTALVGLVGPLLP